MKNYYAILEVSPNASTEVIKAAGKALKVRLHPDKPGGDEEKYKEVANAVDVLCDPQKRAAHDYALAHPRTRAQEQYEQAQQNAHGAQPTGRPVWMNGIGWVIVPEEVRGPFPNDRPARQGAYPPAYPNWEETAQDMAADMAHDIVDQLLQNMFRGRRR